MSAEQSVKIVPFLTQVQVDFQEEYQNPSPIRDATCMRFYLKMFNDGKEELMLP